MKLKNTENPTYGNDSCPTYFTVKIVEAFRYLSLSERLHNS